MTQEAFKTGFFWVVGILVGIAITASTWSLGKTATIDSRVSVIEDTRFSEADARAMEIQLRREMRDGVDEIKECLNKIQRGSEC